MRYRVGLLFGLSVILVTPSALAAPIVSAPEGDLNGDSMVTSLDLQCMVLLFERMVLSQGGAVGNCAVDTDCAADETCRPVFGGAHVCLPGCLAPSVSVGPNPAVACADQTAETSDCLGLVQKHNADLNCDGAIGDVEFQFLVAILLGAVGGPGTPDRDGDGRLNFCDPDSDGDGALDIVDCGILDPEVGPGSAEVCDGVDNDCDLATDAEDLDLVLPACALQLGVCQGSVHFKEGCVAGVFKACGAAEYSAQGPFESGPETLCDGLDNDCDGAVDNADTDLVGCCLSIADCALGEVCGPANQCEPSGGLGDACVLDSDCGAGLHCDEPQGVCVLDVAIGGACVSSTDCGPTGLCTFGTCSAIGSCPGGGPTTDTDGDGIPDACDGCLGNDVSGDADGDGVCDDQDVCPGGDDTVDVNGNGVPDACECVSEDVATKTLNGDPGDFQALHATTESLGAWYSKRSNVTAHVMVHDRSLGAWTVTTLPSMYTGGAAVLNTLDASGDMLFFSHRYPNAGGQGDRVYRYVAGSGNAVVQDLRDVQADPGDIMPDLVAVSGQVGAFHTRRSNVVSRLFTYRRASDTWSVLTLPGKSTGGAAVISAMAAAGDLLFYSWPEPQFGTQGDVLSVYDAAVDTTQTWSSGGMVANPGNVVGSWNRVTSDLVALHTTKSNVTSRVLRYRKASQAWTAIDLPSASTGGKVTFRAMAADGDLLVYAHWPPQFGDKGDVVTVYDATADTTTVHHTRDLVTNPGRMVPESLVVTDQLVAFHSSFNNVVSRVLIWNRAADHWTDLDLPTMYYGGKTAPLGIYGAGGMAYIAYPNPTGSDKGDRIYVYDAATDTVTPTDTIDLQSDPGGMLPALSAGTGQLFAMHTQRNNVVSRVFVYNACTQTWTVDNMPNRKTGGKATVATLEAAGARLDYSYGDPNWPPKGDVVALRPACGCP